MTALAEPPARARATSARPLRILQVVEPGIDGVFRAVETLVRGLLREECQVALAYSDRRGGDALRALVRDVETAGGETLNLRVANNPEPADLVAFTRLLRLAQRFRPEVIHAHSSKAGALARALIATGVRARFCYTPHAYYGLSGRRGLKTALFNTIERVLGRIGSSLLTSSGEREFAQSVLGLPAGRLHLALNPVNAKVYRPSASRAAARAALGLPAEATVIGWVGRSSFQKDPQTFYRSVAPVLARRPKLHVLHIGRGELDDELRALAAGLGIAGRIVRHPHLAEPAAAYQAMDALMMTSRYEGLSLVLLEALASDLPLILSEVPGVADLHPERLSHCWRVPVGDTAGFTAALERCLADRQDSPPSNHRAQAVEHFSVERWLATHLTIYRG